MKKVTRRPLPISFYFYGPICVIYSLHMPNTRDSLIPLLGTLYPWRRHILYVTGAAFVLSCLISLLMHNYYQGKTVFYAASQDLFKPEKVFGNSQQEMYYYGSGEDIDRILTIGNSDEVIDFLIDSFDLWHVYNMKSETPKAHFKLRKEIRENYNILLTKQDALELTIEDKDPQRAANMANAARRRIDNLVRSIIQNSQISLANSFQRSIHNKEAIMKSNLDSLVYYRRKSGIYDAKGQTEILATRVTEVTNSVEREQAALDALKASSGLDSKLRDTIQLIKARIAGYQRELHILNSSDTSFQYSLTNFNSAKGKVEVLESQYERSYDQIAYDLEKLKTYKAGAEMNVSALHLIESAEVPLYKARPKRSLIVLACTVAAFLFSIGAVMVIESYKGTDWKGIMKPPGET
jgi:tyrosine-protein kinase Etk/Wzc